MIQPEFIFGENSVHKGEYYYAFVGIMLFAAIANAFNMHFVYLLAKKLDPAINIFYSYLGFLASSSLLSAHYPSKLTYEKLDLTFFMLIFGIAGTGFFLQNLILMANTIKKPSLMMPFGYLGVVTGLVADLYIFKNSFTFLTFLGIFLTSGGLLSGFLIQK